MVNHGASIGMSALDATAAAVTTCMAQGFWAGLYCFFWLLKPTDATSKVNEIFIKYLRWKSVRRA